MRPIALPVAALFVTACSAPAPSHQTDPPGALPDAPEAVFGALVLNLSASESLVALDVPVAPGQAQLRVYATADAGATWAPPVVLEGMFGAWAHEGSEVWLASHVRRSGVAAELRRSTDAGRTWALVEVEGAVDDPSSTVLYNALHVGRDNVAVRRNGAWFMSTDAGTTWATATAPPTNPARPPAEPCRVGVEHGIVSVACDAGRGWEPKGRFTVFRP